jgi:hypothetical protein
MTEEVKVPEIRIPTEMATPDPQHQRRRSPNDPRAKREAVTTADSSSASETNTSDN